MYTLILHSIKNYSMCVGTYVTTHIWLPCHLNICLSYCSNSQLPMYCILSTSGIIIINPKHSIQRCVQSLPIYICYQSYLFIWDSDIIAEFAFWKTFKFEISNYLTFKTLFMDTGQQKPVECPTFHSFNINQNRWARNSSLLLTGSWR